MMFGYGYKVYTSVENGTRFRDHVTRTRFFWYRSRTPGDPDPGPGPDLKSYSGAFIYSQEQPH